MAYRLGIDLGTTNTVASVASDGAPVQLLGLGANSQAMPLTLYLAEDGQSAVGDVGGDQATSDPSRLIMDPRRQLGTDVPIVIGGQEVSAEQATAALISFVVGRATAQQQQPPSESVLSHPAHWDEYKIESFDRAIAAANLDNARRCTDAEAAVATYAARESLSSGQRVAVYDLSGGSCEVTVLEKTSVSARVLGASEGADHPSGADFDEAVFRLVLGNLGDRGRHLEQDDDPDSRRRLAYIRRACTQAKEALSAAVEAQVPVSLPGFTTTIKLGRQELVSLVRPELRESIAMAARVMQTAGVQPGDLAAMILVGGCCRMPVVAELLQREFKVPIALGTHPEYDVAIGTLLVSYTGKLKASAPLVVPTIAALSDAEAAAPVEGAQPVESASAEESPTAPAEEARIDKELPEAERLQSEHPDVEHAEVRDPDVDQPQAERLDVEEPQAAAVIADSADGDATVIAETPRTRVPTVATEADQPTELLPAVAPTPADITEHSPVAASEAASPIPQETMPDHLIGDHVTSTDSESDETTPSEPASSTAADTSGTVAPPSMAPSPSLPSLPSWAQASAAVPSPSSAAAASSPPVKTAQYSTQMTSPQHPIGQHPPGSSPHGSGSISSPGQYPPGPRGSPRPSPPNYSRSPTSPYGQRRSGGPGGHPPWPKGTEPGPGESRLRLFLIIVGVVVLVGAAVAGGVLIARRGMPSSTTSPSVSFPQKLPWSSAIPKSMVVVPMRRDSGPDRPLYLVDTEGKIKRAELPTPGGGNSNPIMPASRSTIIYANAGKLRVIAADGSGDRKLFNRDPAGCARVQHASWSLADPNVLLISCRVSRTKVTLLVVRMDGRLIRRLDTGSQIIGDATLSPDGQIVLYSASSGPNANGGALYTLPINGTGTPKQLTNSGVGVDADPAWSPDGSQIAFRRRVPNANSDGNEDVFVMNADGSGTRAVASTPAADFKPVWSPDNKNLLIISNRKSDTGGPGKTFDLWLVRERDGKVLRQLGLKAKQITQPFWTLR